MRFYCTLLILLCSVSSLHAQLRPRYSHYVFNPFIYNPAFAAKDGQYELHVNHQRQWIGIQEAPAVSTVSFHTGFNSGMALGLNAYQYTRGLLSTSSAQLAAGYQARLGQQHRLQFGLSGGFYRTGLDYNRVPNPNDPAVLNPFYHQWVTDGQFGLNYHLKGLNLGVTLTSLLGRSQMRSLSDRVSTNSPLESYIVNADYLLKFPSQVVMLQPYALYYADPDMPAQWEAGSILYLYDKIHAGGSFRQDYGFTAMMGFGLNKNIRLGYAYGFASQLVNRAGQGSHEIHLSIRFGKDKSVSQVKKKPQQIKEPAMAADVQPKQDTTEKQEPQPLEKTAETQEEGIRASHTRGDHPDELLPGYYVVIGVYSTKSNAELAIQQTKAKGYQANTGYNSRTHYYYVYLYHSDDLASTYAKRRTYRKLPLFSEAWMLEIKE